MTKGILIELRIEDTEVKCNPRKNAALLKERIPIVMVDSAICDSIEYDNPNTVKILLLKEKEKRAYSNQSKRFNHILISPIEREHLKQLIQETFSPEDKNG